MPPEPSNPSMLPTGSNPLELMRMGLGDPDGSPSPPRLNGFELGPVIGSGGMGTAYLARQCDLDRDVVVKLVSPGLSRDAGFIERLTREARLMAGLRHTNIVTVHQLAFTNAGEVAIVMEHVAGGSLRELLRKNPGGLDPNHALRIFHQTASALAAAHKLGVVHRDVKPENILLDQEGAVRLADFGLAFQTGDAEPRLTLTGTTAGTADYMAPERFHSNDADERADIYALGVVLYEMLTGRVPRGSFPPPHQVRTGLTPHLGEAIMKALRPDPDDRFSSTELFVAATERNGAVTRRRWIAGAAASVATATGAWLVMHRRDAPSAGRESAAVATAPTLPIPGEWQDLLSRSNPGTHAISGDWRRNGDTLESDPSVCILAHNLALPVDYDVRISFTRLSGVHSVALFFTAMGSTGTVDLDGWGEHLAGVQSIHGHDLRHGGGFHLALENGRETRMEIEVRGRKVRVSVDGEFKSEATLPDRSLGVVFPWAWTPPVDGVFLGIGSYQSPTRFHRFEWRAAET